MLIMISNRCDEGCPHCLQDAREDGGLMSMDTFQQAVRFGMATGWHMFLITGGEPTMNPLMRQMLRWFDGVAKDQRLMKFGIATNGTWIEDKEKRQMMWQLSRLKSYMFTQVYTHRRWYPDYDFIQDWRTELEQIPHLEIAENELWMQDLGRARTSKEAQEEVGKNPYRCSCLNAALVAHQVSSQEDYGFHLEGHLQMCSPCVDADGNVHMSESRLCPSMGNVCTDDFSDIWRRMQQFSPCMSCRNSRKLYDNDARLAAARAILNIPPKETLKEINRNIK